MKYWFEVEHAQRWGLPAAAVLAHLKYWIERNTSAGEDPCMTQGIKEMSEYMPFLTASQIKRALSKLEEGDAIYRTSNGFDRRGTFCLGTIPDNRWDETEPSMGQNQPIDKPNLARVHIETNTSKRTESNAPAYERPTEEEVVEYLTDIGGADVALQLGQEFHTHYETTGWYVSGSPMAKWKPKARSWLSRLRNKQSNERRKGFNPKNFTPDGLKDFIDNG
ncbi:hypothetical protein N9F11_01570 [Akkermansiaceae bacterium]|nr:hypothetical protein [Akkermansiaceae bacterium]